MTDECAPSPVADQMSFSQRLAAGGMDRSVLLVAPAVIFMLSLFIYPFFYGLWLSFHPKAPNAAAIANYARFFSDAFQYRTIETTLWLALPTTLINLGVSVPIAMRVRGMRRQRVLTTILVLPITLGTVLIAEGLLNYLGPQGWFNRVLLSTGVVSHPVRLTHNYWGVFSSIIIAGFPFTFLMTLSYLTGIDPTLERAAATLGAGPRQRFHGIVLPLILPGLLITFCLSFVQAFAVFPSAILLGAPAGPTRVISIAAATAAFEEYDYSMASAIAMIMGIIQLAIVVTILSLRGLVFRGSTSGGKG
jgi:putative spermidine/putrescine transport system permease protein